MEELDGCPAPKKRKVEGESSIAEQLLGIERDMCRQLEAVDIGPPVTHIYNPLDYAAQTHSDFVQNYGNSTKKILFVGMNPGPFGMAQNGVSSCFVIGYYVMWVWTFNWCGKGLWV